jgi:hypothetical protein
MSWSNNCPTHASGFNLAQQSHREERLAAASETTQYKGIAMIGIIQPRTECFGSLLLICGELCRSRLKRRLTHPNVIPNS